MKQAIICECGKEVTQQILHVRFGKTQEIRYELPAEEEFNFSLGIRSDTKPKHHCKYWDKHSNE